MYASVYNQTKVLASFFLDYALNDDGAFFDFHGVDIVLHFNIVSAYAAQFKAKGPERSLSTKVLEKVHNIQSENAIETILRTGYI